MNDSNLEFYNNIDVEPFQLMARVGGFNTYVDLELIYPHIIHANTVLELGAGYGRCIDYLTEKKFRGKIIAIEHSRRLVSYLTERFAQKAMIMRSDIKTLSLPLKVDVALWMWSGLIDFSRAEQKQCMRNISKHLNRNGKIIIDIPRPGAKTIATHYDTNHLFFKSPFGILNCYVPNEEDIREYADFSQLHMVVKNEYLTSTGRQRKMFVLQKYS